MKEPFRVRRLQLSLSQRLHRKIAVSKRPPVQAWDAKYLPERCYSRRMPRHTRSPAPSSPRQSPLSSSRPFKELRSRDVPSQYLGIFGSTSSDQRSIPPANDLAFSIP